MSIDKVKIFLGKVISDKMDKTIVVLVNRKVMHYLYGKFIVKSTKFYVHDYFNRGKIGDIVSFLETRPISKTKKWKLISVLKQEKH